MNSFILNKFYWILFFFFQKRIKNMSDGLSLEIVILDQYPIGHL